RRACPTRAGRAAARGSRELLERHRPRGRHVLGRDLDALRRERPQLGRLGVAEIDVAQPLGASRLVMDAAHVDPFHPVAVAGECGERVDGPGEHDPGARIARLPASAARRAASSGGRSRWNTKSSSIARFTPVTSATSELPLASLMELVKQDPPGRSTNSTAGWPAIAAVSRAVSAPES